MSSDKFATGEYRESEPGTTVVSSWNCPVCEAHVPSWEKEVEVTNDLQKAWEETKCPACGDVLKRREMEKEDPDGQWIRTTEVDHVF